MFSCMFMSIFSMKYESRKTSYKEGKEMYKLD